MPALGEIGIFRLLARERSFPVSPLRGTPQSEAKAARQQSSTIGTHHGPGPGRTRADAIFEMALLAPPGTT